MKSGETIWQGEKYNEGLEVAKAANAKARSDRMEEIKSFIRAKAKAKEYARTPLFNDT